MSIIKLKKLRDSPGFWSLRNIYWFDKFLFGLSKRIKIYHLCVDQVVVASGILFSCQCTFIGMTEDLDWVCARSSNEFLLKVFGY